MPAAPARRAAGPADGRARGKRPRGKRAHASTAHQPLEQRILLTATLCLLAYGAVMVYSASSATTLLQGQGDGSSDLIKFVAYGAVGLLLMRVLARDGVAKAQSITAPLLVVSFVLALAVHIPHVGVSVNGARRWLGPSEFQFQPSELLNPLLLVVGAACLLVFTHPDLGTAMVIAFTVSAMLIAAGIPLRKLALIGGTVLGVVLLYALVRPYARARLTSFIDPWAHASSSGFQAVQGQIAIGSGGLFGVGPGQSVQKIFYLPEAPTDFILAVIAEELGVVGVCALLCLYGLIAYAGLRAAKAARSLYSALIAVGVTAMILSQAILNMFAVLGLAPLTGVPLPFVSYGSSSLIVMLAAMGLLLNVAAGATGHVRAVAPARSGRRARSGGSADVRARESAGWGGEGSSEEDRDRRRRDRRARGPGAGGGRSAAG